LAVGLLFSLIPDLDTPKSLLGRLFPHSKWLNGRLGHRTATHSLLALGISYIVGPAAFLGAFSHILLDSFTPAGVQLLWPRNTNYVVFGGPVRTGGRLENALFWLLAAAALALVVSGFFRTDVFSIAKEVLYNWFNLWAASPS